tara:strand:+ start:41924 stop:42100 length:177 start_codon:yes stop_codon:yes gene_type:complete
LSAVKRWTFAVIGSALILTAILGIFMFAEWLGIQISKDHCLDRGGQWDYSQSTCDLPE